nr:hypothetical protein CFP56_17139 [Quercus suber]
METLTLTILTLDLARNRRSGRRRRDRALQSRLRFSTIDKSEDRTSNIGNLCSCFAIPSLIVQQFRLCCSTTENSEAVSRVTSKDGLRILIVENDYGDRFHTKNIVYKEIFDNLPKDSNHNEVQNFEADINECGMQLT